MYSRKTMKLALLPMLLLFALHGGASAKEETQTFEKPKYNNTRVDWCMNWGKKCGQPVADFFCKARKFSKANSFTIEEGISEPTLVIGDAKKCGPGCDSFAEITCSRQVTLLDNYDGEEQNTQEEQAPATKTVVQTKPLGGVIKSSLSVDTISNKSTTKIAIFGRGQENDLWWNAGDGNGNWFGWAKIASNMKLSPSCAAMKRKFHCVYVGTDGSVYWLSQSDVVKGTWSEPTSIGGKTDQSPSLIVQNPSSDFPTLTVVVRAMDGQVSTKSRTADEDELYNWRFWGAAGGKIQGTPVCNQPGAGPFYCLYRNSKDEIRDYTQGQAVKNTDGSSTSRPWVFGKLAYVQGGDGKLWFNQREGNGWSGWKNSGVPVGKAPACAPTAGGTTCFYVGDGGDVIASSFSNSAFK